MFTYRQCPSCGSHNVHRSAAHGAEVLVPRGLFGRYRCRDCSLRFRVLSKRFYGFAAAVGLALTPVFVGYLLYSSVH